MTPLLHQHGYRTLAPDLRGYSPRARPGRRRDYALGLLIGDVLALFDAIGDGPGASGGPRLGCDARLGCRRTAPRQGGDADHPVGSASGGIPQGDALGPVLRSWYMALFQLPRIPESFSPSPSESPKARARIGLPPEYADRLHSDIVAYGALTGALNWYRAMPFWSPTDMRTGKITVPTTPTYGATATSPQPRRRPAHRPLGAGPYEFRIITGANHWLPETRPPRSPTPSSTGLAADGPRNSRHAPKGHRTLRDPRSFVASASGIKMPQPARQPQNHTTTNRGNLHSRHRDQNAPTNPTTPKPHNNQPRQPSLRPQGSRCHNCLNVAAGGFLIPRAMRGTSERLEGSGEADALPNHLTGDHRDSHTGSVPDDDVRQGTSAQTDRWGSETACRFVDGQALRAAGDLAAGDSASHRGVDDLRRVEAGRTVRHWTVPRAPGSHETRAAVQVFTIGRVDVAQVVMAPVGEESGLGDHRDAQTTQVVDQVGWDDRGVLDAVMSARTGIVEGGEREDQRLTGDAVHGDGATDIVCGADPVGQVVEVGQLRVGDDDLVRSRRHPMFGDVAAQGNSSRCSRCGIAPDAAAD